MSEPQRDCWSEWLLKRRFGGNADQMKALRDYLYPIRDKVLRHANLDEGETLLDVGCGDGLIGFGALKQSKTSRVIFSDFSQDVLDAAQAIAREIDVLDRCRFFCAAAEALSGMSGESVDVVTTRSVLIYVAPKQQAFGAFHRVLKPGGRLSIFEPINSFGYPEAPHIFAGYDVSPVAEIAQKLKDDALRIQPLGQDPMLDFDERTLMEFAERAGFKEIHLEFQAELAPNRHAADWNTWLNIAPNPKLPTLQETLRHVLTPTERETFVAYLRPLFEARRGVGKSAVAYLWAVK